MPRPQSVPEAERSSFLQHYYRNRAAICERVNRRAKQRREELMQKIWDYLLDHPCTDCPEADPIVLEFDHVRGEKSANISQLVAVLASWETIAAEIEKCEVRCCNCHRRQTIKRLGGYKYIKSSEPQITSQTQA